MRKIALLSTATLAALAAFAGAAHAADNKMVCENNRRPYLVEFDGKGVSLNGGPAMQGKVTRKNGKPIIDIAATDAPRRKVDFARMEIKFYYDAADNDADQIDSCMSLKDHQALNAEPKAAPDSLAAVKADIKARCTAQWQGTENQYSMIAYCMKRELEALAEISDF